MKISRVKKPINQCILQPRKNIDQKVQWRGQEITQEILIQEVGNSRHRFKEIQIEAF